MTEKLSNICLDSWSDARSAFASKINELGGEFEILALGQKGPRGEELSIGIGNVAFGESSGKQDANLFIHISGVHGVEGFAGSAAQLRILDELIAQMRAGRLNKLPAIRIIFVHTVNAFGMSWLRRNNASNVDLNRNTLRSYDNLPVSEAYSEIHKILTDQSLAGHLWFLRLIAMSIQRGKRFLMQGLSGGQYGFSDGFFYGGSQRQSELSLIKDYFERHASNAKQVYVIDIHTGLGPYGHEALFSAEIADRVDLEEMQRTIGIQLTVDHRLPIERKAEA